MVDGPNVLWADSQKIGLAVAIRTRSLPTMGKPVARGTDRSTAIPACEERAAFALRREGHLPGPSGDVDNQLMSS